MINVYTQPDNIITTNEQWWFVVDSYKNVIMPPRQSLCVSSGPHTMVVADTLEECQEYIVQHNLNVVVDN